MSSSCLLLSGAPPTGSGRTSPPESTRSYLTEWQKVQNIPVRLHCKGIHLGYCGLKTSTAFPVQSPKITDFLKIFKWFAVTTNAAFRQLWESQDKWDILYDLFSRANSIHQEDFKTEVSKIFAGCEIEVKYFYPNNHFGIQRFILLENGKTVRSFEEDLNCFHTDYDFRGNVLSPQLYLEMMGVDVANMTDAQINILFNKVKRHGFNQINGRIIIEDKLTLDVIESQLGRTDLHVGKVQL